MKLPQTGPGIDAYLEETDCDDQERARLAELLSPEEAAKARQFLSPRDCRHYIVCHGRMRELLASRLDCDPREVPIAVGAFGKPYVAGWNIGINLSHSRNLAFYAIAPGKEVGCDVEWQDPALASEDIARLAFSPREIAALRDGSPDLWLERFYLLWTVKEALVKASGQGLGTALDLPDVSAARTGETFRLRDGWTGLAFAPLPMVRCAIVFREASVSPAHQWRHATPARSGR